MTKMAHIENIVTILVASGLSAFLVWITGSLWGLLALMIFANINYEKNRS